MIAPSSFTSVPSALGHLSFDQHCHSSSPGCVACLASIILPSLTVLTGCICASLSPGKHSWVQQQGERRRPCPPNSPCCPLPSLCIAPQTCTLDWKTPVYVHPNTLAPAFLPLHPLCPPPPLATDQCHFPEIVPKPGATVGKPAFLYHRTPILLPDICHISNVLFV